MEKIEITKEEEQKIISFFKQRELIWIVFFVIGIMGFIPMGISFFGDSTTSYFSSPTFIFFILGIIFWTQSKSAIKKITMNEYQVYKAKCKKTNWLGYASVENNEILSKKQNKPFKMIEILGNTKQIKEDEFVGIIQVEKEFWVFSLKA